jgi:hypothetical protein
MAGTKTYYVNEKVYVPDLREYVSTQSYRFKANSPNHAYDRFKARKASVKHNYFFYSVSLVNDETGMVDKARPMGFYDPDSGFVVSDPSLQGVIF